LSNAVPGLFGSAELHDPADPSARQAALAAHDKHLVAKLAAWVDLAAAEPLIAGIMPWHWQNVYAGGAPTYLALGTSSFTRTRAAVAQLRQAIGGGATAPPKIGESNGQTNTPLVTRLSLHVRGASVRGPSSALKSDDMPGSGGTKPRVNVLYIVVDDLRIDLPVYGQHHVSAPNLAKLAQESLVFDNAFCNQPVCSPSRNSFLSGRRPSTTKIWNFHSSFRAVGPGWTTLPGHFLSNSYLVLGTGKLFHGG
jgi:hypothetical protein